MTLGYAHSLSGAVHDYRRVLLLLSLSLLALVPVFVKARRKSKELGSHKRDSLSAEDDFTLIKHPREPLPFAKGKGKRDPTDDV